MRNLYSAIVLFLVTCFVVACRPPYTMDMPGSFRKYEDAKTFKMITADGVMLKAREVKNYPKGDLEFWNDAMGKHLEERGYLLKSKECFKTKHGKSACTLNYTLPYGTDDWSFSETIFVVDDTIVLVEAAGPFARYEKVEGEIKEALKSFEPHLD